MKSKHTLLYVITGGLVVIAGFLTYSAITTAKNPELNYLKYQVKSDTAQISQYKRLNKAMTTQSILDELIEDDINVTDSLTKTSDNIKKAIDLVYNKTKTDDDYNQLSKKLPKLVGQSMSDKLIEISKPSTDQAGNKQAIFEKTDNVLVTFGKYDYKTTVVPVYVAVDYEIPTTQSKNSNDTSNIKGEDLYILTYNLKTKKLNLQERLTR